MPIAVQLNLDDLLSQQVADLVLELFPDPSIETIYTHGEVPHLTLAIYDDVTPESFLPQVADFTRTVSIQPVTFGSLGIFPGKQSALFLSPIITDSLLALHRDFHEATTASLGLESWDHYVPGAWVPHVTLGLNLSPQILTAACTTMLGPWPVLEGRIEALRVIRFFPVETLQLLPLQDTDQYLI